MIVSTRWVCGMYLKCMGKPPQRGSLTKIGKHTFVTTDDHEPFSRYELNNTYHDERTDRARPVTWPPLSPDINP